MNSHHLLGYANLLNSISNASSPGHVDLCYICKLLVFAEHEKTQKTCGSPSKKPQMNLLLLQSMSRALEEWKDSNSWAYGTKTTYVGTIISNIKKANKRIYYLREIRKAGLPKEVGLTVYNTKIRPLLEYASPVWGGIPQYLSDDLQKLQNRCLDVIGAQRSSLPSLKERRNDSTKSELKRTLNSESHPNQQFIDNHNKNYNLRSNRKNRLDIRIPKSGTQRHMNSFLPRATRLYIK